MIQNAKYKYIRDNGYGDTLYFCGIEKEDLPFLNKCENKVSISSAIQPIDDNLRYKSIDREIEDDNDIRFIVKRKRELQGDIVNVGYISIRSYSIVNLCTFTLYIDTPLQGIKISHSILEFIFYYCFNTLNAHKVSCNVYGFNLKACDLYRGHGMIQEACLREELYRYGTYHDVFQYGLLRNEWGKLTRKYYPMKNLFVSE